MRKYQILVFLIVAFLGCISFTMIVNAAEVLDLKGRVQMQSASDVNWQTVERGMQLEFGDSIRTARNSFVDIALDKAKLNTIRIEAKAMVILNSETDGVVDRLEVSKGRVIANLEDLKSGMNFEINTPSAIAGVRGSSYSVYVEKTTDEISAYKDTVFLKAFDVNKKELIEVMVPEGFKTFVERFGGPSALIQIATREFRQFDNVMEDVSGAIEGKFGARAEREKRQKRQKALKKALKESRKSAAEKAEDQIGNHRDVLDKVLDFQEIIEDREKIQELIDSHGYSEEHHEEEQP